MKHHYARLFISFLCLNTATIFYAQDSTPIKELRLKLKQANDDKSRLSAKINMLNQFSRESKNDSVIAYSLDLINHFKEKKENAKVGNLYMTVFSQYLALGDKTTAERYRQEAQKYLQMSDNVEARVLYLVTTAQNLSLQNNWVAAGKILDEVFALQKDPKNKISPNVMVSVYMMSISNLQQQNNSSQAYHRALEFKDFTSKYSKESVYASSYMLGYVLFELKNFKKALEFLDQSESQIVNKNPAFIVELDIMRASCYNDLKDYDKAKNYLNKALESSQSQNFTASLPRIYYLFAHINQQEKNYKTALEFAQKAYEIAPDKDMLQIKENSKLLLPVIKIAQVYDNTVKFANDNEKQSSLKKLRAELDANYKSLIATEIVHNSDVDVLAWEYFYKVDDMLGDYQSALSYYKKYNDLQSKTTNIDNIRAVEEIQGERLLSEQRLKIEFEEDKKRIQLQKEIELKSLKFEYDRKQAAAKTAEERARLLLEEEHKRREISIKYDEEQKSLALKYEQQKKIAQAEQEKKDALAKAELTKSNNVRNMSMGGAATALLLLGFAGWSYNQKRKDRNKIAKEKKKSEDLLLNILPQEVAQELKEKGKSDAKYYDEVSVLFTDFVNFTATSEKIGVQELLEELNICFTEFDNIMGRHGLEKIKTIGDAYLAVSGLPTESKEHAKNAIKASQDILDFIEERKKVSPHALDLRIGIHSGHVIAGIVGVKKFAYDIWGDTVNTAARMEQNGEKGKINISKNTFELVKDDFHTTHRGKISVKGKGELDMYFVEA